jgi:hypothetical protein
MADRANATDFVACGDIADRVRPPSQNRRRLLTITYATDDCVSERLLAAIVHFNAAFSLPARLGLSHKRFGRKPPISVGLTPGFADRLRESEHGALTTEMAQSPQ